TETDRTLVSPLAAVYVSTPLTMSSVEGVNRDSSCSTPSRGERRVEGFRPGNLCDRCFAMELVLLHRNRAVLSSRHGRDRSGRMLWSNESFVLKAPERRAVRSLRKDNIGR